MTAQLLTLKDAADRLALSPQYLALLAKRGDVATVRLGRAVRVPATEVIRLTTQGVR